MIVRHKRLAALAAAVGLAAIFLPILVGVVMGHHANVAATIACNGTANWSVTDWTTNNANNQALNPDLLVEKSVNGGAYATIGHYAFTASNYNLNPAFGGSFADATANTVTIRVTAIAKWGDNAAAGGAWTGSANAPTGCATTTVTSIHNAGHTVVTTVPLGSTVHDSATVSGTGGPTPTGNVTFKWFTNGTCTGPAAATSSTFALSGGSVDATTFAQTPAAVGSYAFQAVYAGSGGTNQRYAGSTGACEPLTVTKVDSSTATEIHSAAHAVVTSVPVGTSVHDKATVTGLVGGPTPTGTVTFTWFTNALCTNPAQATSSALTLSGGSVDATGFAQAPSPAGGYAFQATYSGDANYNGSTGPCEPLSANKLDSATVTTIYDIAGAPVTSAPIGSLVTDSATVSGSGPTPTGTVTFTYFPNTTCSPTGSNAGTIALVSGVASPSLTQTVGVNGGSFQAHYNGDATYKESTGACEPLTATKLDSATTTDIHDASHAVITSALIGSTVHDSATVTGSGPTPTGTVDFTVFPAATCVGVAGTPAGTVTLVNGVAHPSNTALLTSSGLAFKAHYNGDGTYKASDGPCEPLTAIRLDSSTVTEIHDATHAAVTTVTVGTTVHDQATVSGSPYAVPTGTVTFSWYANAVCSGTPLASSGPFALSGGTVDATGFAQTPSPAGSYGFGSSYSGDANYNGSTGACEPLTVTKLDSSTVTTVHDGQHGAVTSAPIGTSVHDSATVSGTGPTPTGTVDFTVYAGTTCSGDGSRAGTVSLVNGVAHPSAPSVVAPGGLSYIAHYNGDGIYYASAGDCEPLTAIRLDSSTRTDIHDANHGVITAAPIGSTVHDSAAVTGTVAGGTPTGTVSFTVYATPTCTGDGSPAGTVALVGGVADPSDAVVVAAGGLSFVAHYNSSATYFPSDGACEPLEALKLSSSTVTTIHDADHVAITSAPVGSTVHDSAVVSGSGPTPTGTVSFTQYLGTQCTGDSVSVGTVTLVNGVADPSNTTIVALGGLSYTTSYSGDQNYDPSRGDCEPLEATQLQSSTVTEIHDADHAVVTSAPIGSTVHDSATVTGSANGPVPTGTVSFTLYANTVCEGEGASAGTVALDGSGVAHPSDPAVVPVGGLSFQAHYNGDSTYVESDGACEPLTGTQVSSSTVTQIHDANHAVVTDVLIGTPVHDSATIIGTGPTPTGTVTFAWFTNPACSSEPAATSGAFALVNGFVDADGFVQTPAVSGGYGFQASYSGDDTYGSSVGACEPLTAHDPTPTPTPTATPTLPPPPTDHPTEPPFPSFTPTAPPPPTATPAPTPEPTPQPAVEPTPAPTQSGEVAGATSKPHVTPPPTSSSGSGAGTDSTGVAAALLLLVTAAGIILLVTPRRRRARR